MAVAMIQSFVLCLSLLISFPAFAQPEQFPFIAEITSDKVNIRSGQSSNFEKIAQLQKGDQVIVVDRSFGWYKINLPSMADSFISDKYVRVINDNEGEVTAKAVNIRAGANVNRTVLGKLDAGDKIRIVQKLEGWYKIVPITQSYGWVSEDLVKFKSKDMALYVPPVGSLQQNLASDAQNLNQLSPAGSAGENQSSGNATDIVSISGQLELDSIATEAKTIYKLIKDDQTVYKVSGSSANLDQFLHYTVMLKGKVEQSSAASPVGVKVIDISEIQLVL